MLQKILPKLKEKIQLSNEGKMILTEILLFVLGFLFANVKFLFGTYPFAIALMGACRKYTPFVFAGAILSVVFLMDFPVPYVVALIGLLGLRIASSFIKKRKESEKRELGERQGLRIAKALFCEDVELRIAVTGLTTLGIGIYNVIANGYVYYDDFVLIFNTVLSSILAFALCGLFEEKRKKAYLLGLCTVAFSLIYAISGFEFQGIDVSIIISYCLVLYASKHLGGVKGGALGIIFGIAQGPVLSSTLGIGGIVSGFLWSISPYLSIMCAFILSMGYSVAMIGYEAIVFLTPELLAASLIMYPLIRFELIPAPYVFGEDGSSMEIYHLENKNNLISQKIDKLSGALMDVSRLFKEASAKTKNPDKKGYIDIALEECEGYCYACPKETICWKRDVATTQDNINKMGIALFTKKEVSKGDVEEKFLHRCPNIEKIMESLNEKNKNILSQSVKNDKLDVSANDYEMISRLILDASKSEELVTDKALTERAVRVGAKCNLVCKKIEVVGNGQKRIIATGVDIQRSKCTSAQLREEMEKDLNIPLNEPQLTEGEGGATLTMDTRAVIEVQTVKCTKSAQEENGDSVADFKNGDKEYMLICDGMGSGRDAHLTSQMCSRFLERLLKVSDNIQLCLSMLNSFIRAKNIECSSTVDLFEINRVTRQGRFVKSGASPSFVKRGSEVHKLQSKTVPIGIMRTLDAEELSVTLNKGDVCVMVSDGIVSSKQDGKWLIGLLQSTSLPPSELAEEILREAKKKEGKKDDMSVIVTVIK